MNPLSKQRLDPQDPVLGYVDRIAYVVMASAMVAACALPIATAFAAEPLPVPGRSALLFNYLGADQNGVVSLAEARRIQGFEAAFHQADENRDGKLTPEEFHEGHPEVPRAFGKPPGGSMPTTASQPG